MFTSEKIGLSVVTVKSISPTNSAAVSNTTTKTCLSEVRHTYPLSIIPHRSSGPKYSVASIVSLLSYKGVMVNGNAYHVALNVRSGGARLGVTTQGYDRVYGSPVAPDRETNNSGNGK